VILVDDDDSLRRALARTIRLAGFDVAAYRSAEELLVHEVPAGDVCMVVDINLPGLGGIALKHTLALAGCVPPTVFITALPAAEMPDSLRALTTPSPVLHKPFSNEMLIDAIEHAAVG